MYTGFRWCPHCRDPHGLDARHCPKTGQALEGAVNKTPPTAKTTPSQPFRPAVGGARASQQLGLIGSVLDNKYRIIRLIGAGGMGQVFEAENILLRRPVAVKVVASTNVTEALVRLQIEARLVAAIQHPNICDVYDVGWVPNGGPYLVLERLVGETLASRLASRRMSTPTTLDVFMQILSAMDAAHRVNIIHRDLKPQNVFLVERRGFGSVAKVLDFGFAKDLGENRITRPGKMVGTPQYMAPEQLRADDVDARADIFAIGIMLYEALAGIHPFAARSIAEMQIKILRENPVPLCERRPDLPGVVGSLVRRSIAKALPDRFQSALEMQDELARCIDFIARSRRRDSSITPPSVPSWMPPACDSPTPASR